MSYVVYRRGRAVARLVKPRVRDMLWTWYQVEPLEEETPASLLTSAYWDGEEITVHGPNGPVRGEVIIRGDLADGGLNVRVLAPLREPQTRGHGLARLMRKLRRR